MDLGAGVARVAITPPVGIEMVGFAGRAPASGLHDDLTATVLVFEGPPATRADDARTDGVIRLAIIACDLLYLRSKEVHAVREAVARLTDLPADHVVVACSHTHYGPLTDPARSTEQAQVGPYLANLVHLLAGGVALARSRVVPCRLAWAMEKYGSGSIGKTRRRRADYPGAESQRTLHDPRVTVLRVDTVDGRPLAAVLNCACHPVSLGAHCTDLSADFPGTARTLLEEQTGAICLFLQGAAGNINPLLMGWDRDHLARLGLPLGAKATRIYWSIQPSEGNTAGGLDIARSRIIFRPFFPRHRPRVGKPWLLWRRSGIDYALPEKQAGSGGLKDGWPGSARAGGSPGRTGGSTRAGRTERDAVGAIDRAGHRTRQIFTEIGQSIVARSPFPHTLYASYTDGSVWYVPTRAAYAEGGYEVTHACLVPPKPAR